MNIKCNVDNIGRDCHSIVSRGLGRNKDYLKRLIDRGQLLCERPVKSRHRKNLFEIIDCLNEIYPNNWEMLFVRVFYKGKIVYTPIPTILFSDVTVENSDGESIFIKEILVSLELITRTGGIKVGSINGSRPHFDYVQWVNGYIHSHIPRNSINSYNNSFETQGFCLGASEIRDLKSQLRSDYSNDLFKLFLLTLNSLIYWESLEGVPYFKMRDVRLSHYSEYKLEDRGITEGIELFSEDLVSKLTKTNNNLGIELSIVNNKIKLSDSKDLYKNIKILAMRDSYMSYIMGKIVNNRWRVPSNNIKSIPDFRNTKGELPFVYMQGRKLEFKAEEPDPSYKVDLNDLDVHPKLVKNVSERIEERIKDQIYRANTIKRLYKLRNTGSSTRQDQVLV